MGFLDEFKKLTHSIDDEDEDDFLDEAEENEAPQPAKRRNPFAAFAFVKERSEFLEQEFSQNISNLMAEGKALQRHANLFTGFSRFWKNSLKYQVVCMQTISGTVPDADLKAVFNFNGRAMQSFHGRPEFLLQEVKLYQNAGYLTILCAGTQARVERIEKEFTEAGIGVFPIKRSDVVLEKGQIAVVG